MYTEILLAFSTLIAIMNPVSTAFVFNTLTRRNHKKLATTASFTAAGVLLAFLFFGGQLLGFFGITIYAFRVAGGLYLAKIGFDMLSQHLRRDPEHYTDNPPDIAIVPLAIPMMSGPGSITSVLVMSELYPLWTIAIAILLVCLVAWIILIHAHYLDKILGKTGTNMIEKILGLIVLVIAVQFVFNGITGYLETLA